MTSPGLTIYGGRDSFNAYAGHLHSLGPLLRLAEWGLLLFAAIHVTFGLVLFLQNKSARPQAYHRNKTAGGSTLGSRTMPYTGLTVLVFVLFHQVNFHFVDKTETTIFDIVSSAFRNPLYVGLYVVAMLIVGLHVSHGFWSAFQTLGLNHGKYRPVISGLGLVFALLVIAGFGLIPVYIILAA